MNGATFYGHLVKIVGKENAALYSKRFGPPDDRFHDDIFNFEALAFYVYTTSMNWHDRINEQLWSGAPAREIIAFRDVVNHALQKLTVYTANGGVVYRGYETGNLDTFLARYRPSGRVAFPGFTSASFKREQAFGGNVFFIIRALTARAVWFLSANFHECEVLIAAGKNFAVMNTIRQGDQAVISLEELL